MSYTKQQRKSILESICDRLIDGESLRRISQSQDMPSKATLFRWMNEDKEFETIITRARDIQAEALFDDMTDLTNRMIEEELDPQAVRVAIWSKQWQASKMKPKKYGDRQKIVTDDGEGNDAPVGSIDVSKLSDSALKELINLSNERDSKSD